MEEAVASGLLRSLSSFLGPPRRRGSKFVGSGTAGGEETFELTRDALKVLECVAPQGLASTVFGGVARELSRESFGSGVTWAVALALSLHSKLRRELPYDVLSHFSVHDVKACVTETGDFCLEVARGCRSRLEEIEVFRRGGPSLAPKDLPSAATPEGDVSWFFDEDSPQANSNASLLPVDALVAVLCQTLYEGRRRDQGNSSGVVERLAKQCLAQLLLPAEGLELGDLARRKLGANWAEECLEVVEVSGPGEGCSFSAQGFLFHISKWSEVLTATAHLLSHEICCDSGPTEPKYEKVRAVLLAGNLSPADLEIGAFNDAERRETWQCTGSTKSLLQEKDEAFSSFKKYCERYLREKYGISMLLIEGSLDPRIETELISQGIVSVSGLGAPALYKLSKCAESFVLADFFSVEDRHLGDLEACVVKTQGLASPCASSFIADSKRKPNSRDRDLHFLALRAGDGDRRVGRGDDIYLTLFVSSSLGSRCDTLVSEVRKLISRALLCVAHGFLPGTGAFENLVAEELRKRHRACDGSTQVLQSLVTRSFILAFEEVLDLSLERRKGKAKELLHFDGFHERTCGIMRALEIVVTLLSTDMILVNKARA